MCAKLHEALLMTASPPPPGDLGLHLLFPSTTDTCFLLTDTPVPSPASQPCLESTLSAGSWSCLSILPTGLHHSRTLTSTFGCYRSCFLVTVAYDQVTDRELEVVDPSNSVLTQSKYSSYKSRKIGSVLLQWVLFKKFSSSL